MVDFNIDESYGMYINGEWTNGVGSKKIASLSPATGEKLATFIDAVDEDVDMAVSAAQEA